MSDRPSNVIQINTFPRDLATIADRISRFKAAGLSTFQAMACSLHDEDWDKVFAAIRTQASIGAR